MQPVNFLSPNQYFHKSLTYFSILLTFTFLFLINTPYLQGQDKNDSTKSKPLIDTSTDQTASEPKTKDQADKKNDGGLSFFPIISYTPENSLMLGGTMMYLFKVADKDSDFSNIQPILVYTLKNQFIAYLPIELNWHNNSHKIKFEISGAHFPESFFGIGNHSSDSSKEDYTRDFIASAISYQPKVWKNLRMGIGFDFEYSDTYDSKSGGIIDSQPIEGEGKTFTSGLGFIINWDYRDHAFAPSQGGFYEITGFLYHKYLGSEDNYGKITVDLRQYFSLLPNHTIAIQAYFMTSHGDVPFYRMALLGGNNRMRGIYEGRYRDKNLLDFQLEYRIIPLVWVIGLTAFVGVGDVADEVGNFDFTDFKISGGFGLRIIMDKKNKIHLRIDIGFSKGNVSPYLLFNEAF